jgi:hypothetical protein
MTGTTKWGFGKGQVHEELRKILYPDLTDNEMNAIIVCLFSHLLVEEQLNQVLFRWWAYDTPSTEETKEKIHKELNKKIAKLDFAKKYDLICPSFSVHFKEEAKNIWELNELRSNIVHGNAVKGATFKGKDIGSEEGAEEVFISAQVATAQLRKFDEMIDWRRAYSEKWAQRLKELGEPLY